MKNKKFMAKPLTEEQKICARKFFRSFHIARSVVKKQVLMKKLLRQCAIHSGIKDEKKIKKAVCVFFTDLMRLARQKERRKYEE